MKGLPWKPMLDAVSGDCIKGLFVRRDEWQGSTIEEQEGMLKKEKPDA